MIRLLLIFFIVFNSGLIISCSDHETGNTKNINQKSRSVSHEIYSSLTIKEEFSRHIAQGQWTIVNVWSTACPYCRLEMPDLQAFHEKYKDNNAKILGLAVSLPDFSRPDPKNVKDYCLDYFIDFPSLLVNGEEIRELTGDYVTMLPHTFFYDPNGKMVESWQGIISLDELESVIAHSKNSSNGIKTADF